MSLFSHRRALALAGLSGLVLTGALATSTAAHADDGSTTSGTGKTAPADDSITDFPVTIADAADAAESKYPDCETTAALLYDTASSPVWDVELTCDSGTVKYVSVNAEDGKASTTGTGGSTTSNDSGQSDGGSTTKDDKPSGKDGGWKNGGGGADKDAGTKSGDKPGNKNGDKSTDDGDAPGTGANADYS